MNWFSGKKTVVEKNYEQLVSQGQFYTLLSSFKIRFKVLLLNSELEDIKVDEFSLEEMVRMMEELLLFW